MRIGVPKEIKVYENRVGLIPASVREAVAHGHEVLVETGAAELMGVSDDDYRRAGAIIAGSRAGGVRQRRADRQGEGAAARRVRHAARGPDAVHLPPPRARSGAGQGVDALGRDGDRV